ncbi:site-specific integrase [bacterium]|nr:site-specific integrase [bacterium]
MAGLMKTKRGFYIARTHLPRGAHPCEIKIPLGTTDYKTALIRKLDVEAKAKEIKTGIKFSFIWEHQDLEVKIVHFTLKDATDKYIKARTAEHISKNTISIIQDALNHLQRVLRPSFPIETVGIEHIDAFKSSSHSNNYSKATVNIRLRTIKTFLIWLKERSLIKEVPKIKMLPVPTQIRYLSNKQFDAICDHVSPYLRRVFHFYRETGCRLSEPLFAEIDGNFLNITAEHAKGRRQRDVYLTAELMDILLEFKRMTHLSGDLHPGRNGNPYGMHIVRDSHEIKYYSREFKKAALSCGIKARFHDLRHTAALRSYLNTRDIYAVARLLGHASVSTTQIYANFDLKRLEQDFPDLVGELGKKPGISQLAGVV